jgi:hypothetical protein
VIGVRPPSVTEPRAPRQPVFLYLQAQFVPITARRGNKKAIFAEAAAMLTAIYHMLKDGPGTSFRTLPPNPR